MANNFVTVRGKKYFVKKGKLDLHNKGITDIKEIKGLENLTNLQELKLRRNQIDEIKGLEHLTNLQTLDLGANKITEIKGLEHLTNLKVLWLVDNPIKVDERHLVSRWTSKAHDVVKYCQKKLSYPKTVENYILDRTKIYTKLRFEDVARKFDLSVEFIQERFEELLLNKKLEGVIDPVAKEFIIRKSLETPKEASIKSPLPPTSPPPKTLSIQRGYETAGEYLKTAIKVVNNSALMISGVSVKINTPTALEFYDPKSGIAELGVINPGEFQSAIFRLKPTRCVDGRITGFVMYTDASGKAHSQKIKPMEIKSICPMLTGEGVNKDDILALLRSGSLKSNCSSFEFDGNPKAAFQITESRVKGLVQVERDEKTIGDNYIAYACYVGKTKYGKYHFATEINITGKINKGILTLTVYSDESAILSGYFYEVLKDVQQHVTITQEHLEVQPCSCPECGALLNMEDMDEQRYARCEFCDSFLKIPSWMRLEECVIPSDVKFEKQKRLDIETEIEIEKIKELLNKLSERFVLGEISEQTYKKIRKEFEERLKKP